MGSSTSSLIAHNQGFMIRARAHIVRNSKQAPPINKEARRDIYTYLNSALFHNQLQTDLDAYFVVQQNRVIKIFISSVYYSDTWSTITVKGSIRVEKPKQLTKAHSVSSVRTALQSLIPNASKSHAYPTRGFGHSLGPTVDKIGIRFYKITTAVNISKGN